MPAKKWRLHFDTNLGKNSKQMINFEIEKMQAMH